MQRFWSWLAVSLGKRAVVVSVALVVVTVALGAGISQLEFATGQDAYLNKNDQVYKDNVQYQTLFGGQAVLTVITMRPGHTIDEIFTAGGQKAIDAVHDQLVATGRYQGVITPMTLLRFSDNLVRKTPDGKVATDPTTSIGGAALLRAWQKVEKPGSPGFAARQKDATTTLQRLAAIPPAQRKLTNRAWVKFLLYDNQGQIRLALRGFIPDATHAQIITRLRGNLSIDDEGKDSTAAKRIARQLDGKLADTEQVTTGASFLLKQINDYLKGGFLTLGAAAAGIMVVILLVLFSVRWRLLPLLVVLVGVVWAFGVAGYIGIPLTVVTIAGLPVMLGIGIDYAIQMHARVEEEAQIGEVDHPIQATARGLAPALLVVTFDAIFAFAALRFAKTPMLRDFGLLLAIGVAVICLASIIIPLAILGMREFRSPSRQRTWKEGPLGRLVEWLGSVPAAAAIPFAIVSVLILVGGLAVEDRLTLQTDPIQWVNQSSQDIKDINTVDREVRSTSEMGVFARTNDVFSDRFVAWAHAFTRRERTRFGTEDYKGQQIPRIVSGSSIETAMGDLLDVPGASDVAPTGAEVRQAFRAADADLRASSVAANGTAFNIVFRTGPGSLDQRAPIVRATRDDPQPPPPPTVTATPSGLAVVGVGLLDNLQANRILLTYLSILFVFVYLTLRLRSFVRSLLSLVPVLIAVGTASLVAYALSLKLSPMTAVGGPLVVAACTEFTSLILLRFVEERQRGHDPRASMDITARRTGRAFIVSALTAIAGVAVLSLSSLPLLRDFGRIVALNVAVALLSALVVLPPMLVWAERRNWISRGLVKAPEPMIATPPAGAAAAGAGAD